MKNSTLFPILAAWALVSLSAHGDTIPLPDVCGAKLRSPSVHWDTFADVEGLFDQLNNNIVQRAADIFSWQDFIALNWPASAKRGEPATDKPFDAPGPRVWETWKEPDEVYLPDGTAPAPWDADRKSAADFKSAPKAKVLVRRSKTERLLNDANEPTVTDGVLPPSLKDQRGNTVRFEIRMNRVLFDYVVANKLYDARVQASATKIEAPPGSMLIKAAWRILGPDDNDFYSTKAWVPKEFGPDKGKYRLEKVGLVGFHIMHKTAGAPQWIWSTFEHVRNVSGPNASFYNARCTDCATNIQTPDGVPNQVTRLISIPDTNPNCNAPDQAMDNLAAMNRDVRKGLGKSVFRNYEQIGTQWPVRAWAGGDNPHTVFSVAPALLGNTTLETFIQNTSSCMGCHAMARSTNAGSFVPADFTFTFSDALPVQPTPGIIPGPPANPANDTERAQWSSILRGHQIATRTYETLPANVPRARMHCQSCHLNAGGNPSASWWVGMRSKGKYPEKTELIARINKCFERSMNGVALCANTDTNNPEMNALTDYMQWLDDRAKALNLPLPVSAFPPIADLKGKADPVQGGRIYLQKCAFCHGANGEGRHESGTYYRPALWGPQSYNSSAGMFVKPEFLPAFLKGNMPFGSGGELTAQEAWDLAAFINDLATHPRPGSPPSGTKGKN